jgi:uncharacterized protein (DUF362 family)
MKKVVFSSLGLAALVSAAVAAATLLPTATPETAATELPAVSELPPPVQPGATVEPLVYLRENTDATDNGVARLLAGIQPSFYTLFGANDVVLIKINSQWAERGGTNTDLLKALIQYLVDRPGGFTGEVIIADNGQGMYGSERRGGTLDWANTNSKDRTQSAQDVADYFAGRGVKVSGVSWDTMTRNRVNEFENNDTADGFVVEDGALSTGIIVSYAKFTTKYGTRVSFKKGVWENGSYDSGRLKVINAPVLKSHGQYQVTGAMKSYMGTPSNTLTNMAPHNSVGRGGMGTQMARTRFPTLNILDMIYVTPNGGPSAPYNMAVQKNMIAASTDPVALDYWASKNVLMPTATTAGNRRVSSMSPDSNEPGSFGYWLRLAARELQNAGYPVTLEESRIRVVKL